MNKRQLALTFVLMIISAVVGALISSGRAVAESSNSGRAAEHIPGSGPKWEYQIVFGGPKNGGFAISELNKLGEQGYEVAGYSTTADADGRQSFSVLLKRPKP